MNANENSEQFQKADFSEVHHVTATVIQSFTTSNTEVEAKNCKTANGGGKKTERVRKLKQAGYRIAEIAKVTGLTERQVRRTLSPKQPKPNPLHETDIDYLINVPQIPDDAARAMSRGGHPTAEQEAICEELIWNHATVQIRELAPLRSERFLARYRKPVKLSGSERR